MEELEPTTIDTPDETGEIDDTAQTDDPAFTNANPGDDLPVAPYESLSVINFVQQCYDEAEFAMRERQWLNDINNDCYAGRVDDSRRVEGQSNEFIPKLSSALEHIGATIKKGLVSFSDWFDITISPDPEITGSPVTTGRIKNLLKYHLEEREDLVCEALDFPTLIEDGIKSAALNAMLILKVHGMYGNAIKYEVHNTPVHNQYNIPLSDHVPDVHFQAHDPIPAYHKRDLVLVKQRQWKPIIELVNPKDFFIDPTGRGLYVIHRTYKDLYQVVEGAETGEYDKDAVMELAKNASDYSNPTEESRLQRQTNQPQAPRPTFRKQVELWEFWGNLLDSDGNVVHENCRIVIANQQYLIVKPQDNPWNHQQKPFVYAPLVRVPFSTTHKALFDQAVQFNMIMNEAFNLAVDGALGSAWGINLVKAKAITNLRDFQGGIPPGSTLLIDENVQLNDVFANVKTGGISADLLNLYNLTNQEFNSATFVSDTKLGTLPKKTQSAAGIIDANASSDNIFSGVIFNLENNIITPALKMLWCVMLQNMDSWDEDETVAALGSQGAQLLKQMTVADRYANFYGIRFKVSGLSSMLQRAQEFQKLTILQQVLQTSPVMAQAFMERYSPQKLLQHFFKSVNLDPDKLTLSEQEKATVDQRMQQVMQMQQLMGGQGAQGPAQQQPLANQQPDNPTSQVQSQINSLIQPPQHLG